MCRTSNADASLLLASTSVVRTPSRVVSRPRGTWIGPARGGAERSAHAAAPSAQGSRFDLRSGVPTRSGRSPSRRRARRRRTSRLVRWSSESPRRRRPWLRSRHRPRATRLRSSVKPWRGSGTNESVCADTRSSASATWCLRTRGRHSRSPMTDRSMTTSRSSFAEDVSCSAATSAIGCRSMRSPTSTHRPAPQTSPCR